MVLSCILEDFLHGTCTSRRINDAALGHRDDTILANTVVEVFGDVGSKRR